MKRRVIEKDSFNGGELSPRFYGQVNFIKYKDGLEKFLNGISQPEGPAVRRPGFQFVASTKDSTKKSRLIPFQFSASDALVLEFGDNYIRFFTNKGVVGAPYEIASPYDHTELWDLTYLQSGNLIYLTHPNYYPRVLKRNTNTDWELNNLDVSPPPTDENGYKPPETLTPAATTGVGIVFTITTSSFSFLAADVGRQIVNLAGEGRASITAITTSTATCTIVEDFPSTATIAANDWKLDLSPLADLTPSLSSKGSIATLTAEDPATSTAIDTFRSVDVGRLILIHGGVLKITNFVSASEVEAVVLKTLSTDTKTGLWSLEDPTWVAENGYPTCAAIFAGRLWFARNARIWGSQTGVYNGFGIGAEDDDAIDYLLSSDQVNDIVWMRASRDLIVGTTGSELTINKSSTAPLSARNLQETLRTTHGSKAQHPISISNEVIFNEGIGRQILSFRYDVAIDGYNDQNLIFFAEHLTENTEIIETVFVQKNDNLLVSVLTNGKIICGTYLRSEEIKGAWSTWETDGDFESVATIVDGGLNQVWAIVKREINGNTVRYVEVLDEGQGLDRLDGFSDSFLTYSNGKTISNITQANPAVVTSNGHGYSNGDKIKIVDVLGMDEVNFKTYLVANATTNTFELTDVDGEDVDATGYSAYQSGGEAHKLVTTLSGLSHLEGKTVQIKADGAAHPNKVVSGGSVTLDSAIYEATVGLPYTTFIKTLRPQFLLTEGSSQGQRVRFVRPILRVYRSTIPKLNNNFKPSRNANMNMDQAVPLYTGDLEYESIPWESKGQLEISLSDPFPLQLQAIFGAIEGGQP